MCVCVHLESDYSEGGAPKRVDVSSCFGWFSGSGTRGGVNGLYFIDPKAFIWPIRTL